MSKFSWTTVYDRRVTLTEKIQKDLKLSFRLDAGVKERFYTGPLTAECLADKPLWHIPFLVVADNLASHDLIDHAWWLIAADRTNEPWGFVTEPYTDVAKATTLASSFSEAYEGAGITVKTWPSEDSPWNPGLTIPIVVTAAAGTLRSLLHFGLFEALKRI